MKTLQFCNNRTAEDKPSSKPADAEADFKKYLEKSDLGQNVSVELRERPWSPDLYYLHGDHLGTATFVTNSQAQATQFFLNLPFGETMMEQMDGSYDNPFKFNAKELDDDTGLYYYGARYYNPRLSIWYGVDPLAVYNPVMETQFYGDGQHNGGVYNLRNLNPYIYCYQNPIRYVDPNGKQDEASLVLQGSRGIRILGTGGAAGGLAGGVFAGIIILTYKTHELQQRFQAQRAHEFNSLSKEQQDAAILKESFPANKKESLIVRDFPAAIQQKITILSADDGKERKVPISGQSGKSGAKDVPDWAKATGERPYVNESGNDFSNRLMDDQYGEGEWNKTKASKGADSEFQKIKKWGDRSFQNPPKKK